MPQQIVIPMKDHYPFGEWEGQNLDIKGTKVRRSFTFNNKAQQDSIQQTIHFLTAINSPYLVNLQLTLQEQNVFHLYYEYCPLKLEKWILSISENIIKQLEQQMLTLLEELTQACIKFQFDPQCLGISQEMQIKYFLKDFTVEIESLEQYQQRMKLSIHQFFNQLFKQKEEESPKKSMLLDSISTTASLTTDFFSNLSQLSTSGPPPGISFSKKIILEQKVESSLKKSMEVLSRYKKMSTSEPKQK